MVRLNHIRFAEQFLCMINWGLVLYFCTHLKIFDCWFYLWSQYFFWKVSFGSQYWLNIKFYKFAWSINHYKDRYIFGQDCFINVEVAWWYSGTPYFSSSEHLNGILLKICLNNFIECWYAGLLKWYVFCGVLWRYFNDVFFHMTTRFNDCSIISVH